MSAPDRLTIKVIKESASELIVNEGFAPDSVVVLVHDQLLDNMQKLEYALADVNMFFKKAEAYRIENEWLRKALIACTESYDCEQPTKDSENKCPKCSRVGYHDDDCLLDNPTQNPSITAKTVKLSNGIPIIINDDMPTKMQETND